MPKKRGEVPVDAEKIAKKKAYYLGLVNGEIRPERWGSIPRTLGGVRDLHKPELGLYRIGSRNHFTTKHALYGDDVAAIEGTFQFLNGKYPLPVAKLSSVTLNEFKAEVREARKQLNSAAERDAWVAAEFHITSDEVELSRREVAESHVRVSNLERKLAAKDQEIARLRGKLLKVV